MKRKFVESVFPNCNQYSIVNDINLISYLQLKSIDNSIKNWKYLLKSREAAIEQSTV